MAHPELRDGLDDLVGSTLDGSYEVQGLLGMGGMGAVFRAIHQPTGHPVALKVVLPDRDGGKLLPRFLREARLASQIRHPHVVELYDSGRWGEHRDRYYIAMELVDGMPLTELLDAELGIGASCGLMSQVLDALGHVHARDILHRDLKPENLFVSRGSDGLLTVKIGDFGIAKAIGEEDSTRLTNEGMVLGTPAYMAPEQATGSTLAGPGIDLYAVGVMLYQLLSGRLPFRGAVMQMLLAKLREEPPAPTLPDGAALPGGLGAVVLKLLARAPEDRYLSAAAARAELRPFCGVPWIAEDPWEELGGRRSPLESEVTIRTGSQPAMPGIPGLSRKPFWGRAPELALLDEIGGEVEAGQGRFVLLRGGAGIGKTALMEEFSIQCAEQGRFEVARHHCVRGKRELASAVERMLGCEGAESSAVASCVQELHRRLGVDDPHEERQLLSFLRPEPRAGSEDPGERQRRHFALVHRLLRRKASRHPLLLTLDDLGQGGDEMAAFLEYLLFEIGFQPFPLLILGTLRSSLREGEFLAGLARTDRFEGRSRRTLTLEPLPQGVLVRGLVDAHGLERTVARRLAERAGGNPLFADLLARAGADLPQRVTTRGVTTFGGGGTSQDIEIPQRLRSLLEADLQEQLRGHDQAERLRGLLLAVAGLGGRAQVGLLACYLEDDPGVASLDDDLDLLLDLGVLVDVCSGRDDIVAFSHGLVGEALVLGLSQRKVRRLHRRAASALRCWGSADELAGRIGDHLAAAGERSEAATWWLRGMDHELARGDAMSGAHLGLLALGELSETDPRRAKSAAQLGRLLADGGDADSALEVLSPLLESPNVDLALEVGDAICDILENKGAGERWLRVIQRMQERLLESGARGKRAYHRARALHLNSHARADEAIAQCELALVGAEPGEETQRASQRMAFACILGGRIEDAQIAARRAMQHSGGRADLRARSLRTLAMIPLRRGHSAQARAFLGEAIEIVRCQAMAARLPVLIADVGNSYLAEQRYEEARARFIESHRAATELDNRWSIIFAEFRLLLCDLLEGKTKNVRERFAELSPRAADAGVMILALAKGPMLAWCDVLEGRHDAALQTIRAYGELRHFPRIPDAGYCTEGIGRQLAIAARLDRPDLRDEAIVMLATASSYWQAMGNLDRQAGVDALREELRAEAADPDAAVPSSVLTGKEGGGRVPGS